MEIMTMARAKRENNDGFYRDEKYDRINYRICRQWRASLRAYFEISLLSPPLFSFFNNTTENRWHSSYNARIMYMSSILRNPSISLHVSHSCDAWKAKIPRAESHASKCASSPILARNRKRSSGTQLADTMRSRKSAQQYEKNRDSRRQACSADFARIRECRTRYCTRYTRYTRVNFREIACASTNFLR